MLKRPSPATTGDGVSAVLALPNRVHCVCHRSSNELNRR